MEPSLTINKGLQSTAPGPGEAWKPVLPNTSHFVSPALRRPPQSQTIRMVSEVVKTFFQLPDVDVGPGVSWGDTPQAQGTDRLAWAWLLAPSLLPGGSMWGAATFSQGWVLNS